uniref:Putative poly(A) polymerase n=1 Tax=Anthurium amnicola TaxID=1678845 RepID=A0A1D1Z7U0_9ARAE
MAITWTNQSPLYRLVRSRLQILSLELGRWMHTLAAEGEDTHVREDKGSPSAPEIDCFNMRSWKVVNSRDFGIMKSSVSPSAWTVLRLLQSRGFQAYLVGGCVRDLLLKRTPKDYDVITTASLEEVRKQFHRVRKVGSRFPICWVYIKGTVVEVSSFETSCKNAEERKFFHLSHMPSNCDYNTLTRWRNCFQRDFTVNSLFYDPCTDRIYDYVDGIRDVMTSKIRTVIPAHLSFEEDSARILRGLRIAARLGLVFSKETEVAIRDLSSSVITLDKVVFGQFLTWYMFALKIFFSSVFSFWVFISLLFSSQS